MAWVKNKDGSWARPAGEDDDGEDGTVTLGAGKELRGVPQRRRDVEPDAGYWGAKNNVNVPVGAGSGGKWVNGGPRQGKRKGRRSRRRSALELAGLGAVLVGSLAGLYRACDISRYEIVKSGQTLTTLASRKKSDVKKAADLNKDKVHNPDLIFPGQRLRIR